MTPDDPHFNDLPGGRGKVYVPKKKGGCLQKHPCPDCFSCQVCSDDRCDLCRRGKKCPARAKAGGKP